MSNKQQKRNKAIAISIVVVLVMTSMATLLSMMATLF